MSSTADDLDLRITPSRRRSIREIMSMPVLAPYLRRRAFAIGGAVIGVVQVVGALTSVSLWHCPMLKYTGISCPGCGLSRASSAMLSGHWLEMVHQHAFAPFFMAALAAFIIAAVLPSAKRVRFADKVAAIERRFPVGPWLLLLLVIYWFARLSFGVI